MLLIEEDGREQLSAKDEDGWLPIHLAACTERENELLYTTNFFSNLQLYNRNSYY